MRISAWALLILVVMIVIAFAVGSMVAAPGGYYGRGYGMMGPGMMGGWWPGFGWLGMGLMWLAPLSFIVLLILAITWLVRQPQVVGPVPAAKTCPNCHRAVQGDWQLCPYCGQKLS